MKTEKVTYKIGDYVWKIEDFKIQKYIIRGIKLQYFFEGVSEEYTAQAVDENTSEELEKYLGFFYFKKDDTDVFSTRAEAIKRYKKELIVYYKKEIEEKQKYLKEYEKQWRNLNESNNK